MQDKERLFVAQAMMKQIGDLVSTKDHDSLRSIADRSLIKTYKATGAKSYDALIDGQKVGTYSVRVPKPKVKAIVSVSDPTAYKDWAIENGLGSFVVDDDAVIQHCTLTGELPEGAEILTREDPGKLTTVLKVEPQKVADAIRGELPQVSHLLEGGFE